MTLPAEAYGAALAARGFGPSRLAGMLAGRTAAQAWAEVAGSSMVSVEEVWEAHRAAGVEVHLRGGAGYPEALAADLEAPAVLFSLGSLSVLALPRVCIVGTRRCTHSGREVARQLGRELAAAGVAVVSGLALGIDGAAHEGALAADAAPPVGVVGSGLDVVYPHRHRPLWHRVASRGVLLSEAAVGTAPEAWRFPARNRILAGVAQVVVVVESHVAGGSLHTVRSALERDITVMAVPGSVRNPAAAGTNQLLADGAAPARDTEDVLVALGLVSGGAMPTGGRRGRTDGRPPPDDEGMAVLEAVGWEPAGLDDVLARTRMSPGRAAVALAHLEETGWLHRHGSWYEQVGAP